MCGLVGMAGNIEAKHDNAMKDLLFLDQLRGQHSTGLAAVGRYNVPVKIFKKAVNAVDFLDMKRTGELFSQVNRCLLGHNRFATKGKVTQENAHPFTHGRITGAHNGTLTSQHLLPDSGMFEVDSENIIYALSILEVQEVVSKLEGAYALTWWDHGNNTINFLRNDDRPLYMAFTDDDKTLVWASEQWMLQVACSRNGVNLGEISMLPVHQHVSYTIEGGYNQKGHTLSAPNVKEVVPRKTAPLVVYGSQSAVNQNKTLTEVNGKTSKADENKKPPIGRKVIQLLTTLGYDQEQELDFVPSHVDALNRLVGYTLDQNGMEVLMVCGGKELAEEWLRRSALGNGFFITAEWISGFIPGAGGDKRGQFIVNHKDCQLVEDLAGSKHKKEEVVEDDDLPFQGGGHTAALIKIKARKSNGNILTRAIFEKTYKDCAWCGDPLLFTDPGIRILNSTDCLCGVCNKDPEAMRFLACH